MIALITSTDTVKLSAIQALLRDEGVEAELFDAAAGALWRAIIPMRVMIADDDLPRARRALREAGFHEARDGDWDLRGSAALSGDPGGR
ncbi:MAG: DUF2007 domain-containing protein [Caulobacteraceae bacterium]